MLLLPFLVVLAAGADEARLAKGEIVVSIQKTPGAVDEAIAKAVIDAAPEVVWSIVSDCANYKNTMPSIIESAAIKSEKPTAADGPNAVEVRRCRVVADLPFPFSDLVSVTRGVMIVDPGKLYQRKWRFLDGDYHVNNGSWTVVPWSDGNKSLATYKIQAQPKVPLPDAMLASIQQGKLPEVMERLRITAKKRAASMPKPVPEPPPLPPPHAPAPILAPPTPPETAVATP